MRTSARLTAQVAATAMVLTGGALATAPASTAASSSVRLAGDVLPHLSGYTDLGPTPSGKHVQLDVTIARPNPAGEQALYRQLYTPGSPSYHDFPTPAEFDDRFGVDQATFDAVRSFATAHGMSLASSTGSRDLLVLDGTVAQVERTFDVSLRTYRKDGKAFYANTVGPLVPSGLSITGVVGLNSLLGMHLFHNGPKNPVPSGTTHGTTPAQDNCLAGTCTGLTTPQDLWSIYDQPGGAHADPNGNTTVDFGQGQQMAVFGEGQTDPVIANLRTFERLHKLPQVPIQVVHTDGNQVAYDDNAGEIEWDLDTQASTGMSPDALDEVLYFGHDLSDQSVLNVFNTWADDPHGPLQANASYGECEENPAGDALGSTPAAFSAGQMFTLASEQALMKANMEGRTLFSSSGDTGSSCPVVPAATLNGVTNEVVPIVNYPASSPHVVDVGGTVVYGTDTDPTQRQLEYTWTYTGGGTSFVFAKPDYQEGIATIAGVCDYSPGGGAENIGKPCRGAPDVAAQSGDIATNGYGIVADGETNYPGGGTSLSSPLWMGMWTRIQATAPKQHGRNAGLGFANETLYRQFKSAAGSRDFFDIGGSTKSPPAGNGFYLSTPGWDYTSGMGAPDVANLAQDINGTTTPTNPKLPKPPKSGGTTSGRASACDPLFTDPSGDDAYLAGSNTGGNPQLDVLSGNMEVSADGTTLRTFTMLQNLTTDPAEAVAGVPVGGSANEYYFLWTYGGTTYFTNAEVDTTTGTVTYSDGTVSGTQYSTVHSDDTGTLTTGPSGTVEVDVPLANVGNPPSGATLTGPGAQTKVLEGTTVTGGLIEAADSGGPHYDYTVGQACSSLG
ncbi:MAG TPA: S53 family peptidase [Nocardioidaceae bacterium]|nr:S53 family peptidase [Nocardioidaceae bacterium]